MIKFGLNKRQATTQCVGCLNRKGKNRKGKSRKGKNRKCRNRKGKKNVK